MAVAGAVLERNAPLPARRVRGRAGVGQERVGPRRRDRDGAVAGQPVRPVLEADAELLAEQQAAESRAVDEQVAAHAPVVLEPHGGDEPSLAILLDADDPALDPLGAVRFGILAKEAAVSRRVEVEGVGDLRQRVGGIGCGMAEAVEGGCDRGHRIARERSDGGVLPVLQPQLVQRNAVQRAADLAELVEVSVALVCPADELDAELVGGVRLAQELGFVDA